MRSIYKRIFVAVLMMAGASSLLVTAQAKSLATVRSVTVTSGRDGIDVEIEASQPVALRSQVTTDPDRLILDFPDSVPAGDLRSKLLNQGDIKGYRVARFSAHPPTTRVVIDLNSPQHYRIYPSGKTVLVKLKTDAQQAAMGGHVNTVSYKPVPATPQPTLEVEYKNGSMRILADRVSLAQVLNEVQKKTGADIPIPPGAAQEQMVANIGMAPVRQALSQLLNGSRFNFIMIDSERDPGKLKRVILSYRGAGVSQPAIAPPEPPVSESVPEPDPQMQPEVQQEMPAQPMEGQGQQEVPQPQENPPPQ